MSKEQEAEEQMANVVPDNPTANTECGTLMCKESMTRRVDGN